MSPRRYEFMVYAVDPRKTSIGPRVSTERDEKDVEAHTPQGLAIMLAQQMLDIQAIKPIAAVLWVNLFYRGSHGYKPSLAADFPKYPHRFPDGIVAVELEQISTDVPWRASRVIA